MKKLSLFISMLLLAGCGTADFLGFYQGQASSSNGTQQVQLQVVSDNGDQVQGQISTNGLGGTTFTGSASGDQMTISIFNNTASLGNCSGTLSGTLTLNGTALTGQLFCNGNTNGQFSNQSAVFLSLTRVSGN